jgi:tRNA-dihydrouridine synthase A
MAEWDAMHFGGEPSGLDRATVEAAMVTYMERLAVDGEPWSRIARHMLGLWNGQPGARRWRQVWSDHRLKGEPAAIVAGRATQARRHPPLQAVGGEATALLED